MKITKSTFFLLFIFYFAPAIAIAQRSTQSLILNDSGYFEKRGLNVLVFSNHYGLFGDEKASGVEIIHHGVRTATNGDIRLDPTPMQWDSIPQFLRKDVRKANNTIEAFLKYPSYGFSYSIKAEPRDGGILLSVYIDKELPTALIGRAGFNLEFLPAAYFRKSFLADKQSGVFPLYPTGPMQVQSGISDPQPIATANQLVLAPEDDERRITIRSSDAKLFLYDGRNKAQNGWFVVRSLIPAGKTGKVIEWFISANTIPGWIRKPVISHSQLGYHPQQEKKAVIELDKNDSPLLTARLLKINEDGEMEEKWKANIQKWGNYLRYNYFTFDFSSVKEPGLYIIEYGKVHTKPFRIAEDIYENAWHPTLDIYFPVQMDHMYVKEAYRVWHGASHLDDALQAPINHEHFDLYAQGPSTDSPYKPGEHIPGLNSGGWYDAGDYDIRTQTQYGVVLNLVQVWELFKPQRDETSINQETRHVIMHLPDGKPDILQQIEQGTLQLLAQQKSVGHAINGIVEAHLSQYTHLGDASTKTDNLVYNAAFKENQSDGRTSGNFDDRWAFTSKSTPLNYGSIAALAAASRALKGYNDQLADECLSVAKKVWDEEHAHAPDLFRHGNTTGGGLEEEELKAAIELLTCTGEKKYADQVNDLLPFIEKQFGRFAALAIKALPWMDSKYKQKMEELTKSYAKGLEKFYTQNPFGVPITTGGWAGSGQVIGFALTNYVLHKAFPSLVNKECVFRGLNYIYGCHPGSDISFVSDVGTESKEVAYGNNRADFTFIAGGVVPGELILHPDFPENKEDWPFLWGENEYVISEGAAYIFLVQAVNDLLHEKE